MPPPFLQCCFFSLFCLIISCLSCIQILFALSAVTTYIFFLSFKYWQTYICAMCIGSERAANWPSAIGRSLVPGDVTVCCMFQRMTPPGTKDWRRGDGQFSAPLFTSRCQTSHRFGFRVLFQLESVLSFLSQCTPSERWPLPKDTRGESEERRQERLTWGPGSSWSEGWLPGTSGLHPSRPQGQFSADGRLWSSATHRYVHTVTLGAITWLVSLFRLI